MATSQWDDQAHLHLGNAWKSPNIHPFFQTGWRLRISGVCWSSPQKVGFPESRWNIGLGLTCWHLDILSFSELFSYSLWLRSKASRKKDDHFPRIWKKRETWFQLAFSKSNSRSIIPNSTATALHLLQPRSIFFSEYYLRWVNWRPNIDGIWPNASAAWDNSCRCDAELPFGMWTRTNLCINILNYIYFRGVLGFHPLGSFWVSVSVLSQVCQYRHEQKPHKGFLLLKRLKRAVLSTRVMSPSVALLWVLWVTPWQRSVAGLCQFRVTNPFWNEKAKEERKE